MTRSGEMILEQLGLPYRRVLLLQRRHRVRIHPHA